MDLSSGARFGRYRIDALVDRGGMGAVYRATDVGLDRPVALKLILPELAREPGFRERFEREARSAARLDHPNVVPVYESGEEEAVLFLAMRFVEGTDLRRTIAERGALEPAAAAAIVAQVAAALDAAHERGLIHRDVKPANVLLTGLPGAEHAYLGDFGLAKRTEDEALTSTGQTVGTLDYMAPEQIESGDLDHRVDVYALGCLLFHALTGRVPYPGETGASKMAGHLLQPPPSVTPLRPDLPAAFDTVVARAMAKRPEERFSSAGELGAAALAAVEGKMPAPVAGAAAASAALPRSAPAAAPTSHTVALRPRRRPRFDVVAAALAGVAAVVLGVLALGGAFSGGEDPRRVEAPAPVTDEEPAPSEPSPETTEAEEPQPTDDADAVPEVSFDRRVETICTRAEERIDSASSRLGFGPGDEPESLDDRVEATRALVPVARAFVGDLRRLDAPPSRGVALDRYLAILRETVRRLERLVAASDAGDDTRVRSLARELQERGDPDPSLVVAAGLGGCDV